MKVNQKNNAKLTPLASLLKAASIKYFDENGKEKEFTRTLRQPKASAAR